MGQWKSAWRSTTARRNTIRRRWLPAATEAEDFFPTFGSNGRWLYFTTAPLRDAQGKLIGAIETLQDITEQKRAEEQLRQSEDRYRVLSITDGMTGLYNARHFAQRLRDEMDRAERYHHSLALLVLDVDNFKKFSDTWGHVQGDQVLIQLAECISACLRRTDQAFRYGGEEFVALLPEADLDKAEAAAERIRSLFVCCAIMPAPDQEVTCTASIGVTTFVAGESPATLSRVPTAAPTKPNAWAEPGHPHFRRRQRRRSPRHPTKALDSDPPCASLRHTGAAFAKFRHPAHDPRVQHIAGDKAG